MRHASIYTPGLGEAPPGTTVQLEGSELAHLRALRLGVGDTLQVTDGEGGCWRARIDSVSRHRASLSLSESLRVASAPSLDLVFGLASRDRTLWLVEKAVELGVTALRPVECARSRSVADAARSPAFWEKAHRRAVSALEQSGAAWLPKIHPVVLLVDYLGGLAVDERGAAPGEPNATESTLRLVASLAADRSLLEISEEWDGGGSATLLVGPEGGLEIEEEMLCERARFRPVGLGPGTLRFETAAVAGLAVLVQRSRTVQRKRPASSADSEPGGSKCEKELR